MLQEVLNMSCGQTELTEACKKSIGRDVFTIYSPPFWDMEEEVLDYFKKFMYTKNDIIIVFGTGTSGIEASLNSILEPGDRFLVISNGMFGEIMSTMVRAVGAKPVMLEFEIGSPVDPEVVAKKVRKEKDLKGIGMVHGETSVGITNSVKEIGDIAQKHDLLFMVDAVSSLASEELFVDEWNIDLCIVNGQKCLSAPQGNTFISVSPRVWEVIDNREKPISGFYMNLLACKDYIRMARTERKNWNAGGNKYEFNLREAPHPASPSFVILKGIWASLNQLDSEGLDNCIKRHELAGSAVRSAIKEFGLSYMCKNDNFADNAVTAVFLPDNIEDYQFRKLMFEKYGVILGDANMMSWKKYKYQVGRNYVRFGTMGEAAKQNKIIHAVSCFGLALREFGEEVNIENAITAVNSIYNKNC